MEPINPIIWWKIVKAGIWYVIFCAMIFWALNGMALFFQGVYMLSTDYIIKLEAPQEREI